MADDTDRQDDLDAVTTILGLLCGCGILAMNVWVFMQVY